MEMHLLPMAPTDSQAHSPCFRDFNTHTVFPNPLGFTFTLCLERWEHCHSLSALLPLSETGEHALDCAKPPPLITNGFKSVEVHKPVAMWGKNWIDAFPGLPYPGCSIAYIAAQILSLIKLKHALDAQPLGFLSWTFCGKAAWKQRNPTENEFTYFLTFSF